MSSIELQTGFQRQEAATKKDAAGIPRARRFDLDRKEGFQLSDQAFLRKFGAPIRDLALFRTLRPHDAHAFGQGDHREFYSNGEIPPPMRKRIELGAECITIDRLRSKNCRQVSRKSTDIALFHEVTQGGIFALQKGPPHRIL